MEYGRGRREGGGGYVKMFCSAGLLSLIDQASCYLDLHVNRNFEIPCVITTGAREERLTAHSRKE